MSKLSKLQRLKSIMHLLTLAYPCNTLGNRRMSVAQRRKSVGWLKEAFRQPSATSIMWVALVVLATLSAGSHGRTEGTVTDRSEVKQALANLLPIPVTMLAFHFSLPCCPHYSEACLFLSLPFALFLRRSDKSRLVVTKEWSECSGDALSAWRPVSAQSLAGTPSSA